MQKNTIRILCLVQSSLAVILNCLPTAVKMRFAGPEQYFYKYCSGFDLLPIGYAVWGPMLSGIASIALTVLGIWMLIKPNSVLKKWMIGLTVFGMLMSISPLITGTLSYIGFLITSFLAIELAALVVFDK